MNKLTIEEIIEKDGMYLAPTVGDSMEPLLHNRKNTVVIKKIDRKINNYDVILYKRPNGQYVLHRVIKIKPKKGIYYTLGDNRFKKERVPFSWGIGVFDGYYQGEDYISINDKNYQRYVNKLKRNLPFRRIKLVIKRIFKK